MNPIDKALRLKQELDALRPLKKEDELRILQKFRLDWNFHSNKQEGNSLSFAETKALILFGITAQGKPLKDHFEITGHDEAIKYVMKVAKLNRPLTENLIQELHKLILKEPYKKTAITPEGKAIEKWVQVGAYKTSPNHVKTITGEIFRFATPEETPAKMGELIDWYRQKLEDVTTNPVLLAPEFHYKFIHIHPFDDGNGRMARILMNYILLQYGYPPVIIKSTDKASYHGALRQADAGILSPFVEYVAKNLLHSLGILFKEANGTNAEEEQDEIDKEIELLERKLTAAARAVDTSRSETNLFNLYDDSITHLVNKFVDKCTKFSKFYVNTEFSVAIDGKTESGDKDTALANSRKQLGNKTKVIKLKFNYKSFMRTRFDAFNYAAIIQVRLNPNRYEVTTLGNAFLVEKLYNEALSSDEIEQLVRTELRRHTAFIELKIEEAKRRGNF